MSGTPLDPTRRPRSRLGRVAADAPVVAGAFLAGTVALGFGVANPVVDAVGLIATGAGFEATQAAVRGAIRRSGRELD
jgi:hypothetical protein